MNLLVSGLGYGAELGEGARSAKDCIGRYSATRHYDWFGADRSDAAKVRVCGGDRPAWRTLVLPEIPQPISDEGTRRQTMRRRLGLQRFPSLVIKPDRSTSHPQRGTSYVEGST